MIVVWLSAWTLDVPLHMVNLLKGFRNIGRDEKWDKYICDGRVLFLSRDWKTLPSLHDSGEWPTASWRSHPQWKSSWFSCPITQSRYRLSKICLSWLDYRKRMFFSKDHWHKRILISVSIWIRSNIMNLYDLSSSAFKRLFILPRRSKQISARIWILVFLIFLSSSLAVPNLPARNRFSKLYNPGRIVPKATSRLECPKRKAA